MSQHTQESWQVNKLGNIITSSNSLICVVLSSEATPLLLAAPDLLEFAKQVVKFAADHSNFYLMAWAQDVVNKAEGKS